jgi:hypothetical protein
MPRILDIQDTDELGLKHLTTAGKLVLLVLISGVWNEFRTLDQETFRSSEANSWIDLKNYT